MLMVFFVFIREVSLASIVLVSAQISKNASYFFLLLYFLQFFFSPIQAGYSDHYCRRKSLIFGFSCILVGKIFLILSLSMGTIFLFLSMLINGFFGNLTPIARAALLDKNIYQLRTAVSLTAMAIGAGWLVMVWVMDLLPLLPVLITATLLVFASLIASYFFFKDERDKDQRNEGAFSLLNEVKIIMNFFRIKWVLSLLISYLAIEIAFYEIWYYYDINLSRSSIRYLMSTWAGGYCFGVLFPILFKFSNKRGIFIGMIITTLSFGILLFANIMNSHLPYSIRAILNLFFGIGYAFTVPCLSTLLSENRSAHFQGKVFGLIDSTDTLAEMAVPLILIGLHGENLKYLQFITLGLILFACLIFYKSISAHPMNKKIN